MWVDRPPRVCVHVPDRAIRRFPILQTTVGKMASKQKQVQVFGRKRNAIAVATCKEGKGMIRLNGAPLHLAEPAVLRTKVLEPILLLGRDRFAEVDIRIRVKGGGQVAQVFAIRQAIAKASVAYTQKCEFVHCVNAQIACL